MMDQEIEPMEVEEDAQNFDEFIESEFRNNDSKAPDPRTMLTLPETRYENKGGTFLTGIDIFSKEEEQKIEERAKRFGMTDKQIFSRLKEYQDLYTSMGVTEENENTKNFRLNVLHMRGTAEMSTKDVFKYFEDYAPANIEWINDFSCNVVWVDSASAARALVGLSKKILGLSNRTRTDLSPKSMESNDDSAIQVDNKEENDENEMGSSLSYQVEVHVKDIEYPLPPGIWRKGIDCPKSKEIFMRFATRMDRKQPHAEKLSGYYKKYGNPNFGGVRGILTETKKRTYRQTTQSKKRLKEISSDQDGKVISKNPWGGLSQTWGVNDTQEEDFIQKYHVPDQSSQSSSIKERLGSRIRSKETPSASEESGSEAGSDSEDEWCKKSKIPRMRMHADDEEEKVLKRRSKLQETSSASRDLRSRLGRTRKEPVRDAIQIVVSNVVSEEEEEGEIVDTDSEDQQEHEGVEEEQEDDVEVEGEEDEDGVVIKEVDEKEEGEEDSDDDSEVSEKEVRGPKGSVIKVVPRKPRLASTVWTRLHRNSVKSEVKAVNNSQPPRRDLRETLRGDLRSRLGKPTKTRGRSPLRIEVKNDKCAEDDSDSE